MNTALKLIVALALVCGAGSATVLMAEEETRVIVLGTGTPVLDYERAGAGIAVIHRGEAYLFDVGDGVVRRLHEAHQRLGIDELRVENVDHVFITHFHSDHMHDYGTLGSARWWYRDQSLHAWGPEGLEEITRHVNAALEIEGKIRTAGTPADGIRTPGVYQIRATDIEPGVIFRKDDLTVEAFDVPHGGIRPAVGYKIETPGRSIVISGDTAYSEEIIRQAKGVDLLFHEVISADGMRKIPEHWQRYHRASHTPTDELAKLAVKARPKKLVLYHILFYGQTPEEVVEEVRAGYDGDVVLANDLDIF
jgi:ribonuclease Z